MCWLDSLSFQATFEFPFLHSQITFMEFLSHHVFLLVRVRRLWTP